MKLAYASDNLLYLLGLTDNLTGSYVTNATVTAEVCDRFGTAIETGSSVTLSYVSGSLIVNGTTSAGGNYRGQLPYTASISAGGIYLVKVTAIVGSNRWYDETLVMCEGDNG